MRLAPVALLHVVLALAACDGTITPGGDDSPIDGTLDPTTGDDDEVGPMITFDLIESTADVLNPERGYYVGYNLRGAGSAASIRSAGYTIAIAQVNLEDYRDSALDDALLAQLDAGFAQVRAAGIKVILRFKYNSGFVADASKARILGHLEQLTPLLHDNADVISVMQAGFIGAWGEWHGSTNGLDNDEDRAEILDAILAALPSSRGVQVRRPMFKDAYLPGGALVESEAYTSSAKARIGHHNDCFLASASDYGTYDSPVEQWEDYVSDDGRFTAIGGETCAVYLPKTSCASAVAEMETAHWSYLNRQYHQAVIAAWAEEGCDGEIRRRLGYRFALDRVAHTEAVAPGGVLALDLDLHNSGFASPYNRRPVEIVLSNGSSRHVVRLESADARRWAPGTPTTLSVRLRIPADLAAGSYTLSLRLPDDTASLADDPRYAIQLANDELWDEATGDNVLTRSLAIDPSAPGPRDSAATSFTELF